MKRVYITTDDSGHYFVIPYDRKEEFNKLLNDCINDDYESLDKFEIEFSKYMTGGDVNLIEFYSNID